MTARQMFEALLIELSKVNAPSMLLQDFNYFFNKAVNLYINKRYNLYDTNLQTTDDLRVLKSTAILRPTQISEEFSTIDSKSSTNSETEESWLNLVTGGHSSRAAIYAANLPTDYLHLLNCICIFKIKSRYKCYNTGDIVRFPAKRLTSDMWSTVLDNYYTRPLPLRPYYFIHNVNINSTVPTNPYGNRSGTDVSLQVPSVDMDLDQEKLKENLAANRIFDNLITAYLGDNKFADTVERETGVRYGNPSNVRLEIRYGLDNSVFDLIGIAIDYIKVPQYIRLTQELVNLTLDTSQILEFPDYVCQEIINELVHLVLENIADPRILTHPTVTQSIASPVSQLATPQVRG